MTKQKMLMMAGVTIILSAVALAPYLMMAAVAAFAAVVWFFSQINVLYIGMGTFTAGLYGTIVYKGFKDKTASFTQRWGTFSLTTISLALAYFTAMQYTHNLVISYLSALAAMGIFALIVFTDNDKKNTQKDENNIDGAILSAIVLAVLVLIPLVLYLFTLPA